VSFSVDSKIQRLSLSKAILRLESSSGDTDACLVLLDTQWQPFTTTPRRPQITRNEMSARGIRASLCGTALTAGNKSAPSAARPMRGPGRCACSSLEWVMKDGWPPRRFSSSALDSCHCRHEQWTWRSAHERLSGLLPSAFMNIGIRQQRPRVEVQHTSGHLPSGRAPLLASAVFPLTDMLLRDDADCIDS
jgi:hypothetical protein